MKLILCPECLDVVKAGDGYQRSCACGLSWAEYTDALNAEYGGKAIPLGILNDEMAAAVRNQPGSGDGARFTAFVIPKECPTYKRRP